MIAAAKIVDYSSADQPTLILHKIFMRESPRCFDIDNLNSITLPPVQSPGKQRIYATRRWPEVQLISSEIRCRGRWWQRIWGWRHYDGRFNKRLDVCGVDEAHSPKSLRKPLHTIHRNLNSVKDRQVRGCRSPIWRKGSNFRSDIVLFSAEKRRHSGARSGK
jgi:hypothetical protein